MISDLFILIPCHAAEDFNEFDGIETNDFARAYISQMSDITKSELVSRVSDSMQRKFLGTYELHVYNDAVNTEEIFTIKTDFILTCNPKTKLSVLTIAINNYEETKTNSITHIIDQVTREDLVFTDGDQIVDLCIFMSAKFKLHKNGEAKMCLIQPELAPEEDRVYYMATETKASDVVDTKIIAEKYKKLATDNRAIYDFSNLYISESLVYEALNQCEKEEKLQFEGLLIFIVELLMLKLSAIYRANNKIQNALDGHGKLNLKNYEAISMEFANTLSVWQINVYRYKGAQSVADMISEKFEIDNILDNYQRNDGFLQNIINTHNARNSFVESWILFAVAVILFFKEVYLMLIEVLPILRHDENFTGDQLISLLSTGTSLLIVLVIIAFTRRQK